jgi:hypothetical protein
MVKSAGNHQLPDEISAGEMVILPGITNFSMRSPLEKWFFRLESPTPG